MASLKVWDFKEYGSLNKSWYKLVYPCPFLSANALYKLLIINLATRSENGYCELIAFSYTIYIIMRTYFK